MSQETENRLQLACIVTFDDSEVGSFIANQGFDASNIQVVADAGIGENVLILRPEENPADRDTMIITALELARTAAIGLEPVGAIGPLENPPFAANVLAASQAGDVCLIISDPVPEGLTIGIKVTQIVPSVT